jgi:hypothetical protein
MCPPPHTHLQPRCLFCVPGDILLTLTGPSGAAPGTPEFNAARANAAALVEEEATLIEDGERVRHSRVLCEGFLKDAAAAVTAAETDRATAQTAR